MVRINRFSRTSTLMFWPMRKLVGLAAFSLLGHGITGAHGDELTAAQYAAHTVGLLAASILVLIAQRKALRSLREVSTTRIAIGSLASVAVSWLGVEVIRPPFDWIFAFTVLGTAAWIRLPHHEQGKMIGGTLGRLLGVGEAVGKS